MRKHNGMRLLGMTPTERRIVRWCRKVGADLGQLDIMVEDIKCQQANLINNHGLVAQVRYLLKHKTPLELKQAMRHELKMLRQHHMSLQSKTKPKKNRRIK